MPTVMIEYKERDYLVDYHIQPATGNETQRRILPEFYNPAYVYDVKVLKQNKTKMFPVKSKKIVDKITEILNEELNGPECA